MRINKFLASCGLASRRSSEQLVLSGKVKVNGAVIKSLSIQVDECSDVVEVDNKICSLQASSVYLMMHKPKGYLCTKNDVAGRKTIYDLIKGFDGFRLFSIGRLDRDTEGLILLTNDGDFANKLIHPRNEINKVYIAKIEGKILPAEIDRLQSGVIIDDDYKTAPARVKMLAYEGGQSRVELTIHEGKNRQVRKMFQAIGKQVNFLKRTEFAGIKLGGLGRGEIRLLKQKEISYLKNL